tara:strand:- start:405 stop:1091 length:687 start_codon:yes stop_codon:yes gene_type:complete
MNLLKSFSLIKIIFLCFSKDRLFYKFILNKHKSSNSQLFQDLFAFYYSGSCNNGFFVEVGVGNGKDISNTYFLEMKKKWRGLLCEADTRMIEEIKKNRTCKLISTPVSSFCKKKYKFFENLKDPYLSASKKMTHSKIKYTKSICINHLLEKNNSPRVIDYMSIDTEGNEYEIIRKLNFKKWKVKTITIEHNFNSPKREQIYNFLIKKNYKRVCAKISYMDDWYVLRSN